MFLLRCIILHIAKKGRGAEVDNQEFFQNKQKAINLSEIYFSLSASHLPQAGAPNPHLYIHIVVSNRS